MRARILRCSLAALVAAVVLSPARALAQDRELIDRHDLTTCSVVGVLGGVSLAPSDAGAAFGGMVGWPFTGRFGMEVSAAWANRQHDSSSLAAELSFRHNLTPQQTWVPYVKAGIGVYVARLDTSRAEPPDFYARRLADDASRIGSDVHTFADPAIVVGGGASWFVARRLAIRPEVETYIVVRGAHARAVTSVAARLEYHFEDFRITR